MNEFQGLVKEIAAELEDWEYIPRTDDYYNSCIEQIGRADGANIVLVTRGDFETARIEIYGQYPRHEGKQHYHSGKAPQITVAAKRGAMAIAKDIKRRFLPDYLYLYEEATTWVQQKVEADNKDTTNLTAIAEALGVATPKSNSKVVRGPRGHFEANYNETFTSWNCTVYH